MKLRIAVSACLLGEAVRYDGKSKPNAFVLHDLARSADLIPVCPEVAIGLGVPRPPVELVDSPSAVRVLGVNDRNLDITEALAEYAYRFLQQYPDISGMVLKSRSPSCGFNNTPIFSPAGVKTGITSGLFAATIVETCPDLPVISETELEDNASDFLHECRIYSRLE